MKLSKRLKQIEEKLQPQNEECLTRLIYEDPDTGERSLVTEYTYKPMFKDTPPIMEIITHIPGIDKYNPGQV